jgi:hypothetical protein
MELESLKKSLVDLDDNELRALLTDIRTSRRTSKKPPASVKKAKEPKGEASADALINSLTTAQVEQMLALLGGK